MAIPKQVDRHHAEAALAPLEVGGRTVALYGWPDSSDLHGLRAALGIPVDLLAVALDAFDDFPETEDGVRRVIDEKRQLLLAVPLGADLSSIVDELVNRRLLDAKTKMILVPPGDVKSALLELFREAGVR